MQKSTTANLVMILVTSAWGLTFPLIHIAERYLGADSFVLIRFCIASLLFFPLAYKQLRQQHGKLIKWCILLGALNLCTYSFQCIGLETISTPRSAFITGINVLLVPFLMPLFRMGKPRGIDVISALCCLAGLYLLTGANIHALSVGDLYTFGCALTYAITTIIMQIVSNKTDRYLVITFYQILFTALFVLPFGNHISITAFGHWQLWLVLLFCAVIATMVTMFLQVRYQKYTTPTKVALIFSLEPVFASIFSYLILNIHFTWMMIAGGIIILGATILPDLYRIYKAPLHTTSPL